MKKLRRLFFVSAFIIMGVLLVTPMNNAHASESVEKENMQNELISDVNQGAINNRMQIVMDYLNTHAQQINFNGQASKTFVIPVGGNHNVIAEISNVEETKLRGAGTSTHIIGPNSTYTYTLNLRNVVGSGDYTTFSVNYSTGSASSKDTYILTINRPTISGVAPSGYSVGSKAAYIISNGAIIVQSYGYINYTRTLFSDKKLNMNIKLGSTPYNNLTVNYSYTIE